MHYSDAKYDYLVEAWAYDHDRDAPHDGPETPHRHRDSAATTANDDDSADWHHAPETKEHERNEGRIHKEDYGRDDACSGGTRH